MQGSDIAMSVCDVSDFSTSIVYLNILFIMLIVVVSDLMIKSGVLNLITRSLKANETLRSGIYQYRFKVSTKNSCTDAALITVTICAYARVSSVSVSTSAVIESFNLFHGFNGLHLQPQSNGQWFDDDRTRDSSGTAFDSSVPMLGSNGFRYMVEKIGKCPS